MRGSDNSRLPIQEHTFDWLVRPLLRLRRVQILQGYNTSEFRLSTPPNRGLQADSFRACRITLRMMRDCLLEQIQHTSLYRIAKNEEMSRVYQSTSERRGQWDLSHLPASHRHNCTYWDHLLIRSDHSEYTARRPGRSRGTSSG